MGKQFPDVLYVRIDDDDSDETYYHAYTDPGTHAEPDEKVKVGVYRLVKQGVVEQTVSFTED